MTESAPGLKRARQNIGLPPERLSEETGVSVEHISNLESGGPAPADAVEELRSYFARKYGHDIRTPSA